MQSPDELAFDVRVPGLHQQNSKQENGSTKVTFLAVLLQGGFYVAVEIRPPCVDRIVIPTPPRDSNKSLGLGRREP
jgi:hypothetical protein